MNIRQFAMHAFALCGWVLLAEMVGILGTPFTFSAIPTWYAGLVKPSFSPPNWLFGPVWTLLYLAMGIAAYRVWAKPRSSERTRALIIYIVQLALNAAWTPVFFGLHNPLLGLVIIASLLIMIATTIVYFWRVDRLASMLLAPYIAWVSFATALNAAIWILN